jgi:hypothetical protein
MFIAWVIHDGEPQRGDTQGCPTFAKLTWGFQVSCRTHCNQPIATTPLPRLRREMFIAWVIEMFIAWVIHDGEPQRGDTLWPRAFHVSHKDEGEGC